MAAIRSLRGHLPADARIVRTAEGIKIEPRHMPLLMGEGDQIRIQWTEATYRFVTNRQRARNSYASVRRALHELASGDRLAARQAIRDSDGLTVLDDHQVVNVAAMTVTGGFGLCLFDEQGPARRLA